MRKAICMKQERYKYSAENELMYFEFISTGPKGQVKKMNSRKPMSKMFTTLRLEILTNRLNALVIGW